MKTRLLNLWDKVRGSFWFLPAVVIAASAVTGVLLPELEDNGAVRLGTPRWLATTPEGARAALSGIAGAMITVAGVVFSVTMVTLSIASSQFGSRVLRSRMRNRATQVALGAFLGTSVYCFLVLTTVRQSGEPQFVPHLSVALAIAGAVGSLFVLIYFIHDVAESIQAPYVVASLAADLDDSIERLFPEKLGRADHEAEEDDEEPRQRLGGRNVQTIESTKEGYLQAIDGDTLLEAATKNNALVELNVRPGDFITTGDPVAKSSGGEPDALAATVNEALIVGKMRTPRQDVNCAIHELAQLTVRALSPGINDPFTAMNGIDRLSAALGRLAQREVPSCYRRDAEGRVRVIAERAALPEAMAAAFNQIRQNAGSSPPVGTRLLEGLESIAHKARRKSDREAILQQARLVRETYRNTGQLDADLRVIREQYERIERYVNEGEACRPDVAASPAHGGSLPQSEAGEAPPPTQGEVNG